MQLALVALGGLVVRLWAVLAWTRWLDPQGDQNFYWRQGQYLARGLGFVYRNNYGEYVPTAVHPPLYSTYLGAVSLLGGTSHAWHRLASTLLGAAAVVVIGLAARRVAGDRAAVFAAVVAAVWANLWILDAMMLSESMYTLTIALVLLASYTFRDDPRVRTAVALGASVALAALARAEATFLFLFLVVPLVLTVRDAAWRARLVRLGAAAVAGAVVLAPWIVRNALTFDSHPLTVSNGSGFVLEIANCDQTYGLAPPTDASGVPTGEDADKYLGYWNAACDRTPWPAGDETVVEAAKRRTGVDYLTSHKRQLPTVVAARVGRMWEVWRPWQSYEFNWFFENRGQLPTLAGMALYYPVLVLGLGALVVLWRRKVTIIPFVAIFAMTTLTAAVSFGITRYRVGADVALCVLAGVAVDAIVRFDRRRVAANRAASPPGVPA